MIIKVENYTKKIKNTTILKNVNITMESGKIYGFRGPNGCGKTMLMRAVCGLINPTTGRVLYDEKVLGQDISFPESIGLLIEYPSFVGSYTGFKNLKMIASIQKKISDEKIRESLQCVGLDPDDKRTFRKYSLGMKQKLGIACAIMEEPEVIILDEPVNALDEAGIQMVHCILEEYKDKGALIIIACHDKEQMNLLADEIYTIEEGRITGYEKISD